MDEFGGDVNIHVQTVVGQIDFVLLFQNPCTLGRLLSRADGKSQPGE